ncbi:hypothetical protein CCP1ISM_2310002 [Azospirillaceae bacterium]
MTASHLRNAVAEAISRRDGIRPATVPVPESGGRALEGVHILVVEDNPINQRIAQRVLELAGATITVAGNGQEALNRINQPDTPFDLVLMDIQMPIMDGLTATSRIRRQPDLSGLPIIALTAGALDSDRQRCLAAGMNGFIAKPFDVEQMVAEITTLLGRTVPGDSVPGAVDGAPAAP